MCIPETQLLRLVAGELADDERLALEAHLSSCASCRAQYEELRRSWEILGHWPLPEGPADLTGSILAAAAAPTPPDAPAITAGTRRAGRRPGWLRVAAAIAVASAVGVCAGLAIPGGRIGTTSVARHVTMEEVVWSLGLDVLGSDTGLTDGVLDDGDPASPQEDLR